MPNQTMTTGELQRLADRMTARGSSGNLVAEVTALQDDCWLAARAIRVLLRHVSPSDTFNVFGSEGEGQ